MKRGTHVQDYTKGLNKDLSTEQTGGSYYSCENLRINSYKGSAYLSLTNDISMTKVLDIPQGKFVLGYCNVRDTIVIFTTDDSTEVGGAGYIYSFKVNFDNLEVSDFTLVYSSADLLFSSLRCINAIGAYESSLVQRVKFSDFKSPTRALNLATVLPTDPIESITMFPGVDLEAPVVTDITPGGNLKTGIYEYFYYFSTADGKDTLYSPNSTQIHIVKDTDTSANDHLYFGNDEFITNSTEYFYCNKSATISVIADILQQSQFKTITFGVIFATNETSTPTVQLLETKNIVVGNNYFVHSGLENSVTIVDYNNYLLNQFPFYTNKCFAIKDNSLVVSNIKSQTLDIDWQTETFRYQNVGGNLTTHPAYTNPYNDESGLSYGSRPTGVYNDWLTLDQYKFQSDGVTLGGESLDQSIKYKFTLEEVGTDNATNGRYYWSDSISNDVREVNGTTINNKSYNSFGSPFLRNLKGYKREEIYRFGLVGKKNGNYSFVKYIGDIKMPSISDVANYTTFDTGTTQLTNFPIAFTEGAKTYLFSLGIEFTIDIPTTIDIDSYEIVRVPRTNSDKTRFSSGVISRYYRINTSPNIHDVHAQFDRIESISGYYLNTWNPRRDFISYFTPEASFEYNYPTVTDGAKLKVVGYYDDTTRLDNSTNVLYAGWGNGFNGEIRTKAKATIPVVDNNASYNFEAIRSIKLQDPGFGDDDMGFSLDGVNYRQYTADNDDLTGKKSYCGQSIVIKTVAPNGDLFDTTPSVYTTGFDTKAFLIDYVLFRQDQYGGIGEQAVAFNNFISITDSIKNTGTPIITRVLGGDIYVCWYEFLKRFWDQNEVSPATSAYEAVMIPVETTVNINLNTNKTLTKGQTGNDGTTTGNYLTQEQDTFRYNKVFSRDLLTRNYFAKPLNFKETGDFSQRTYLSNVKIAGETTDSHTKFSLNGFFDVDGNFGPINSIENYMNEIFFFQDFGLGYISINPRAILSDDSGVPTKLGSAKGFERYVYLSQNSGCIHRWGTLVTESGLYFIDGKSLTFGRLSGTQKEDLSTVKGMDSVFSNLEGLCRLTAADGGDNPITGRGVHLGYNKYNDEVYITILGNFVVANSSYLFDIKKTYPVGSILEAPNGTYYQLTSSYNPSDYSGYNAQLNALISSSTVYDSDLQKQTIVFNPSFGCFTANYGFTPSIYINNFTDLLSPNPNNTGKLYMHNKGASCVFYDNPAKESLIEFYVSDMPTATKIIEYIQYDVIVRDSNDLLLNKGLDYIKVSDEYQDSTKVSLINRQRNRFNTWKIQRVPRNTTVPGKISRIRNDWFKVSLWYDNTVNTTINLERIFTNFLTQP